MPNIRSVDMLVLDAIFEMGGGYVLDFSDRTFRQFFAEELNIDIDDPRYAVAGGSKGKRLRQFLQIVDTSTAAKSLEALWEYREAVRSQNHRDEWVINANGKLLEVINKLRGGVRPAGPPPVAAYNREKIQQLSADLLSMAQLAPHARGYAFETFLQKLFHAFGLAPREPFRLSGEQIDGSFILSNETYLLEAKWQNAPCDIGDLHTFHGKVEQKAAWSRGLFVSYSGFSSVAFEAFGRSKRIICMDGYDLSEVLRRELPLNNVLDAKVRRAGETGNPFPRVAELYP